MIHTRKPASFRRMLLGFVALALVAGCSLTERKGDEPAAEKEASAVKQQVLSEAIPVGYGVDKSYPHILASIEGAKVYGTAVEVTDEAYLGEKFTRYQSLTVDINGFPIRLTQSNEPFELQ